MCRSLLCERRHNVAGFRNNQTGAFLKQDVLVMENLFLERKGMQVFDLKGSMRSRYVQNTGRHNVLMDENFLEFIAGSPLYLRQHSKVDWRRAARCSRSADGDGPGCAERHALSALRRRDGLLHAARHRC